MLMTVSVYVRDDIVAVQTVCACEMVLVLVLKKKMVGFLASWWMCACSGGARCMSVPDVNLVGLRCNLS